MSSFKTAIAEQKRIFRDAFLLAFDTACLPLLRRPAGSPSGVLIVRLDGVGDFFLWLSAARALREQYAGRNLTLVADAALTDFAGALSIFDEVIPVQRRRFSTDLRYRYAWLSRIRQSYFELAIHPCFSRAIFFRDAEAIMRAVVATSKVGSQGEDTLAWQRCISSRWYNRLLFSEDGPMTEIDRNAEFMRELGFSAFEPELPTYNPRQDMGDPHPNKRSLKGSTEDGMAAAEPYYVLIPGAGSPRRRWPPEHFARIAERVYEATGWTGVICGGPDEAALGQAIRASASAPLTDLIGTTPLVSLVEIIAGASLLIGNETGAVHIATAVSTPSVCITGGGHYGRFVPYAPASDTVRPLPSVVTHPMPCFNCDWKCVHHPGKAKPAPCVAGISVEDVWTMVDVRLRSEPVLGR